MAAESSNQLLPTARRKGIGRWWNKKIGRRTPEHIVFRCGNIRRVKDERGRREWATEEGMK